MRHLTTASILMTLVGFSAAAVPVGKRIQIRGEMIDSWCYFSGVMGSPETTLGTAHYTCAMWCAKGGIPVGLLTDDGTVYMVLKINNDDATASGDTVLRLASHEIVADGIVFERDGLNYIIIDKVVEDHGVTNLTHKEYGAVPPFAIPDPNE